jgi:hypothetical protein
MKSALLILILVASGSPLLANPYGDYQRSGRAARGESSSIDCETVRFYVGQMGLGQAKALARAAGMTASQDMESKAVPCQDVLGRSLIAKPTSNNDDIASLHRPNLMRRRST